MKKLFALCCLAAAASGAWSCSDDYDDTALWQEIEQIKTDIASLNQQVTTLQTAMQDGALITQVTETTEGYKIDFSNNTSIVVKHGTNGTNGTDGAKIGVKEENGVLYWTLDGEFITAPDSQDKIPVTVPQARRVRLALTGIRPYWPSTTRDIGPSTANE